MNDKILEKWKEKTKGLFHLVEYTRFWNYITNLQQENERKDNIINEIEKYFFGELQLYGGGGIAEENYKKIIELRGKDNE